MMYRAKITSKGQVTIPVDIRRALGVAQGDSVVFETQPDYVVVRREKTVREVSEEIRAATAGHVRRYESDDEAIESDAAAEFAVEDHSAGLMLLRVNQEQLR